VSKQKFELFVLMLTNRALAS